MNSNFKSVAVLACALVIGYSINLSAEPPPPGKSARACGQLLDRLKYEGVFTQVGYLYDFKNVQITKENQFNGGVSYFIDTGAPLSVPPEILSFPNLMVAPDKGEKWSYKGVTYDFADVGYLNFGTEIKSIDTLLATQLSFYPSSNFIVEFGPKFMDSIREMKRQRWHFHDAVLNKYREVKGYLPPSELGRLIWPNIFSGNSDVFGILKGENLAMTIQISYYGERSFTGPSVSGMMAAMGYSPTDREGLPFEYRLKPREAKRYRDKLYSRFRREETCEFTRYALFDTRLPKAVKEALLFRAFRAAQDRGMRVVLASVDRLTSRLFSRYHLKVYSELPTATAEKEYMMYIQIGGPEFTQLMQELQARMTGVEMRPLGQQSHELAADSE